VILTTSWDALEADFTRFYSTDLRAACFGSDSWGARRVLVHIEGLPADSVYARSFTDGRPWSQDMELAARVGDEVALFRYVVSAYLGLKPPALELFPRPDGDPVEEPKYATPQQLAEFLKE